MSQKEYQGLLKVASEQVTFGIFALEKSDYAELCCDKYSSITQLKRAIDNFKKAGWKVHANGR